ncbi:hypothetical protein TWF481_003474 [Arthrobotrys musiformis]|uniref:ADF-H domain-containing protein n=1 Tax=Arthrobotrys musiformis TaxID=47236 RepID=A0AAV9VSW8_9PEZI
MASESRLYVFSEDTRKQLRKFRLSTSRANTPQARIYAIDRKTLEIKESDSEVYTSLEDIADALPENTPRYVVLSHPVTLKSGRLSTPYVLLYYMPENSNNELRMLYAGAKELMRNTAEVGKVMEVEDEDSVLAVKDALVNA